MRRNGTPIQTLLLRTFLPAVVVVAMTLAVLVYNLLYASIIDGFDRKLVTASALTGALIDPQDHDALIRAALSGNASDSLEEEPVYLRNVEPMRRIRETLNLTYLYSQVTAGGPLDVVYVLDSSLGDEHSTLGSTDELTRETIHGLKTSQADGSIYVSPIEYQEQWGLLKTAAAPVYGNDGEITATAGADVNISVIQVATQNALFASALIGIGSILACVAVALVIVRLVARPIAALKQEALRIAAGDTTEPAPIKGPREVGQLRDALAVLAEQMTAALAASRALVAQREREADAAVLADDGPPRSETIGDETGPREADAPFPALPEEVRQEQARLAPVQANIGEEVVRNLLAIRGIAPFDMLTESELLLVARHVRRRRFAANAVLLQGGHVAEMLLVVIEGEAVVGEAPAPQVFDAASALFGLPVVDDYRAGPEGMTALCLAKPHLFTIARECPEFVVGLTALSAEGRP